MVGSELYLGCPYITTSPCWLHSCHAGVKSLCLAQAACNLLVCFDMTSDMHERLTLQWDVLATGLAWLSALLCLVHVQSCFT